MTFVRLQENTKTVIQHKRGLSNKENSQKVTMTLHSPAKQNRQLRYTLW